MHIGPEPVNLALSLVVAVFGVVIGMLWVFGKERDP